MGGKKPKKKTAKSKPATRGVEAQPAAAPVVEPVVDPLLPAVPPMMPLATTSAPIPSFSYVAAPAAPVTTSIAAPIIAAPAYGYDGPAYATTGYTPGTTGMIV